MSDAIDPALNELIERVRAARSAGAGLDIRGQDSKRFYGQAPRGEPLSTLKLCGISSYQPSELVVTARAGTPLAELEAALTERGQCLPFEPPRFGGRGTVGGMVATGLSGPARMAVGSVRDHVLGATLLNGRGEVLSFGGQVMKNVAGYDVSRLLVGSLGVLGLICEVSLKVLAHPRAQASLRFEMPQAEALQQVQRWLGEALPVSASAWLDGQLTVRFSGAPAAVRAAAGRLGGERLADAAAQTFWSELRDHAHDFFVRADAAVTRGATLWRLALPPTAPPLPTDQAELVEWDGGQRWVCLDDGGDTLREWAASNGGHATRFKAVNKTEAVFSPLRSPLDTVHRRLKLAFDPDNVFNGGRLYPGLGA